MILSQLQMCGIKQKKKDEYRRRRIDHVERMVNNSLPLNKNKKRWMPYHVLSLHIEA